MLMHCQILFYLDLLKFSDKLQIGIETNFLNELSILKVSWSFDHGNIVKVLIVYEIIVKTR